MTDLLTPLQADLLRAAFLRHHDALSAWRRWRDSIDWNLHLDPEAFALLPAVYRNLHGLGVDDPLFPRFKGIARQSWLVNQRWIAELQGTLTEGALSHIEFLVLPPTGQLIIDPSAVRNNRQHLSWAVRPEQAELAIRCLHRSGWRAARVRLPPGLVPGYVRGTRYLLLENAKREPLMLTWGLEWWFDDRSAQVWSRSLRQSLGKQPVRGLDPTDALEFVLRKPLADTLFGRIAEVLAIAAGAESIDWDRLHKDLGRHPFPRERLATLHFMQPFLEQWGVNDDLNRWCGNPLIEGSGALGSASPIGRYGQDWEIYRQAWGDEYRPTTALMQLPGYLMGRWQLSGPWQLPKGLARWLRFKRKTVSCKEA